MHTGYIVNDPGVAAVGDKLVVDSEVAARLERTSFLNVGGAFVSYTA